MSEPIPFVQRIPDLPIAYGKSRLICLVKNLNWVYVFWELLPEQVVNAYAQLGQLSQCRKILRVHKGEAGKQEAIADITVDHDVGSHYLYLADPGKPYCIEFMVTDGDRFISLRTSNFVVTPFGKESDVQDEEWATIDELYERYKYSHSTQSSPMVFDAAQKIQREKDELDLEVYTELIIHGKATPGANVFIQGEQVDTKDNGSFSLRYSLEEGTYVYPIKAVAVHEKTTRTIVPVIMRETY